MNGQPLFRDREKLSRRIEEADHILVALDFDGTIAPIAATPEAVRVPAESEQVLGELAASDRISLAIVSGRSLADLKCRLPLDQAIYVGNHGLEIEGAGFSYVHEGACLMRQAVDLACWELEAALYAVRGVRIERKGLTATVHYRQAPADLAEWIQVTVAAAVRPYRAQVEVSPALQAWEIRPKVSWNKGSAVRLVWDRIRSIRPALICAGDDITDEDMFGVMPGAISIRVGEGAHTRARYSVESTQELLRFLQMLLLRCPTPSAA